MSEGFITTNYLEKVNVKVPADMLNIRSCLICFNLIILQQASIVV